MSKPPLIFHHSTSSVPCKSGTFWVKALNQHNQNITVLAQHSCNIYHSVNIADKRKWIREDLADYWIEVELD